MAAAVEEEHSEASGSDARLGNEASQSEADEAEFVFLKISDVDELGSLSTAIHGFQCRLNELQDHLCFIHTAIDARCKQHNISVADTKIAATAHNENVDGHHQVSSITDIPQTTSTSSIDKQSESSELEHLCQTMCSRGLRKYIVSHLSDQPSLRHQIPLALKCAPNPAKLVFDCIGRFYLQGTKAYTKDSPMIPARQASILILELFLLSGAAESEIEPSLKPEAGLAAIAWRKRLVTETGSCQATDIDATGLLLFLASFGIPTGFTNDDLRNLLRSSNSKEISNALRRSHALLTRIPDIIKGMMKNSMNVEAVDIVYAFRLEDVFPPQQILLSFLQECDETWKKRINEVRGSTMQLRRVNEEKLASLKRVLKCLEDHKLDPVKSLPGWKIHEMIKNLEKDIVELAKRMEDNVSMKRKTDEACAQKYLSQEIKRLRMAASQEGFPVMSYPVHGSLEQNAATFLEDKSCFISSSSSMPQIASSLRGHGLVESTVLPVEMGSSISSAGSFPRGMVMGRDSNGASVYKMGLTHEFAFNDTSVGQSFIQQATHTPTPTPPPPVESYSTIEGLRGHTTNNHLDLYHFADAAVFESDTLKSSSTQSGTLPRLRQPHHQQPPYFYN